MWKCPDCERWFNAGKRFREHHFKHPVGDVCEQQRRRETVAPGYLHRASQLLKRLSITRMLGAAASVCHFLVHG